MDLRETELDGKDWIHLAQDMGQWQALVDKGNEPSGYINAGKLLSICRTGGCSRRVQLHC
jgi:hypothetical protein